MYLNSKYIYLKTITYGMVYRNTILFEIVSIKIGTQEK